MRNPFPTAWEILLSIVSTDSELAHIAGQASSYSCQVTRLCAALSSGVLRMSTDKTRLHGRRLVLARVSWAVLVVLTLAIFFASLPTYITLLHTQCVGPTCGYLQLNPEQAA